MSGAVLQGVVGKDGVTRYACVYDSCKVQWQDADGRDRLSPRLFGTVTDLNVHDEEFHGRPPMGLVLPSMATATDADRAAVDRLLGRAVGEAKRIVKAPPQSARTPHGSFRNSNSPERRDPDMVEKSPVSGLVLRHWRVRSESSAFVTYEVTERDDSKNPGDTYFHCSCQSWPMMRGKGRDCKHIKEVVA